MNIDEPELFLSTMCLMACGVFLVWSTFLTIYARISSNIDTSLFCKWIKWTTINYNTDSVLFHVTISNCLSTLRASVDWHTLTRKRSTKSPHWSLCGSIKAPVTVYRRNAIKCGLFSSRTYLTMSTSTRTIRIRMRTSCATESVWWLPFVARSLL